MWLYENVRCVLWNINQSNKERQILFPTAIITCIATRCTLCLLKQTHINSQHDTTYMRWNTTILNYLYSHTYAFPDLCVNLSNICNKLFLFYVWISLYCVVQNNRVMLRSQESEEDYINASFVKVGFNVSLLDIVTSRWHWDYLSGVCCSSCVMVKM